jgi:hypothetical protein
MVKRRIERKNCPESENILKIFLGWFSLMLQGRVPFRLIFDGLVSCLEEKVAATQWISATGRT